MLKTKELRLAKKQGTGKVWHFVADDGRTLCAAGNRGGTIEIVADAVAGSSDLFCKRCEKVADLWLRELNAQEK